MKLPFFVLCIACLCSNSILAQYANVPEATLFVKLKTSEKEPLPLIEVWLTESKTEDTITGATDRQGKAEFKVNKGFTYTIHLPGAPRIDQIAIPSTAKGLIIKSVTYDGEIKSLETSQTVTDTIWQPVDQPQQPGRSESVALINLRTPSGRPVSNVDVRLSSRKFGKVYATQTNSRGIARLVVNPQGKFDLGIEDLSHFHELAMPNKPGIEINYRFEYVPTVVVEVRSNDTLYQTLAPQHREPSTSRVYYSILVTDLDGNPLPDEPVSLLSQKKALTYTATTDAAGRAYLLIPKGDSYILNFKYEREVDLFELESSLFLRHIDIEYSYRGSQNIEQLYTDENRDEQGFFKEFGSVKVTRVPAPAGALERTDQGYNLNLPDASPSSTPAIHNNQLFLSGGYYSPEFYSVDAKTGRFLWSIKLSESGASSAVYESGVVLVNTYSCTLYALDAKSGKLLWSKWLGPSIYSTPTVIDNKVYAVYPSELSFAKQGQQYALVCFDLKTGAIQWQSWMDAEALGAPVAHNNFLYVTTLSGSLYQFSLQDGSKQNAIKAMATTPPLVTDNKLYISSLHEGTSTETVKVYHAQTLQPIQVLDKLSGPSQAPKGFAAQHMNFNGSRLTQYQGKNYGIMGERLICSDPNTGEIVWSQELERGPDADLKKPVALLPVIAGGRILVATQSGKLKLYNTEGVLLKEYETGSILWTQPSLHNGWIYTGTKEGKMVSINTKDPSLTGWPMWNHNAAHNTLIE